MEIAKDEKTLVIVSDGIDGEMSAEQLEKLNQASADASSALSTANSASSTANNANSKADSAVSTANTANTKVDNLEVGARNLLPFKTWCKNIQLTNYTEPVEGRFSVNNTVGSNGSLYNKPFIFGEIGQKYTFSSKPYSQATTRLRLDIGTYDGTTFTAKDNLGLGGTDGSFTKYQITRDDVNAVRVNYTTGSAPIVLDQVKIEKGDKATDWTPAPEDVQANIDLKYDASNPNGYTDDTKATQVATNLANNYTTTNGMNSAIGTAKSEAISTASQDATNKVNALEVGGVNLIRDTGDLTKWRLVNTQAEGNQAIISHGSSQSWGYYMMSSKLKYNDIKNRTITVSMFVKSDVASNVGKFIFSLGRTNTTSGNYLRTGYIDLKAELVTNLNTEWKKIIATKLITDNSFIYESSGGDYLYMQVTNYSLCNIYVKDIQMEFGDKATAWSPSPEDTQAQIDNINKHLVIDEDSVDIVGDDGRVYASYGETATFYGGRSSLNLAGDGLDLKSEDGTSVFSVQNNADGASISEKFNGFGGFTSKSFTITKRFKTYSKINILLYDSTYTYEASSTSVTSGSVKLTRSIKGFDGSEESSYTVNWNVSGTTLTVTLSSAIPNALIYNIEIFGNGEAEANIKFNGCIIDGIVERGKSGSWNYTKWLSGECELYGTFTKSLALTTNSGNAYSTSGDQTELLPFSLVTGVAVGNAVDKFTEAVTCHVEGQNLIWRPFRHASSSSASRTYAFVIKGRWKQ